MGNKHYDLTAGPMPHISDKVDYAKSNYSCRSVKTK